MTLNVSPCLLFQQSPIMFLPSRCPLHPICLPLLRRRLYQLPLQLCQTSSRLPPPLQSPSLPLLPLPAVQLPPLLPQSPAQLHRPAGRQPAPMTLRRRLASWQRNADKPESSGRGRSRNAWNRSKGTGQSSHYRQFNQRALSPVWLVTLL